MLYGWGTLSPDPILTEEGTSELKAIEKREFQILKKNLINEYNMPFGQLYVLPLTINKNSLWLNLLLTLKSDLRIWSSPIKNNVIVYAKNLSGQTLSFDEEFTLLRN